MPLVELRRKPGEACAAADEADLPTGDEVTAASTATYTLKPGQERQQSVALGQTATVSNFGSTYVVAACSGYNIGCLSDRRVCDVYYPMVTNSDGSKSFKNSGGPDREGCSVKEKNTNWFLNTTFTVSIR